MRTTLMHGTVYDLFGVYDFESDFQSIFLLSEGGGRFCKVDLGRRRNLYIYENTSLVIIQNNTIETERLIFPEGTDARIKLSDVFKKKGIECWASNEMCKHYQSYPHHPAWEQALNEMEAYISDKGFAVQDYNNWDGFCTCSFNMILLKKNWLRIGGSDISTICYRGWEDVMYKSRELIKNVLGQSNDISKEVFAEKIRLCNLDAEVEIYERHPNYETTNKCWWCLS